MADLSPNHPSSAELRCPALGILAGGRSQRMGFDKATTLLAGLPMILHVALAASKVADRLYVLGRTHVQGWPTDLPVTFLPDDDPQPIGPVAGILALLRACQSPALILGCDIPLIRPQSIQALWNFHNDSDNAIATLWRIDQSQFRAASKPSRSSPSIRPTASPC